MKIAWLVILMITMSACKTHPVRQEADPSAAMLSDAARLMQQGEYYRARKLAGKALEISPASAEAQELMVQILALEMAAEKKAFESAPPEEQTAEQKSDQTKVWLERGETLLSLGHYDQAMEAAENVFLTDSDNVAASGLIDRIRKSASEAENQGKKVWGEVARDEIRDRIENYRQSAERYLAQGQTGAAAFEVEKIQILDPKNSDARRLKREIETWTRRES